MIEYSCVYVTMASPSFNEDSRVKIPVILQLVKLGYDFVPKKEWRKDRDARCNVLRTPFKKAFVRLNPGRTEDEAIRFLENTILPALKDDDLGKQFYRMLTAPSSGEKLVYFDNFDSNTFHVATEVDCTSPYGDEFRTYINITQMMLFSNNMEYEDGNRWLGSFYCTAAKGKPPFNFFREPEPYTPAGLRTLTEENIMAVLRDTNLQAVKDTPEFQTACQSTRPALRFASSMLCRERLSFFLKLGIAYVNKEKDGTPRLEKHIMRYPQYFASVKIRKCLSEGRTRGVIWHTQGSGKTALAYFSVRNLTEYYKGTGIVPKFFFIVDRIDLANQAKDEFTARGLQVVLAKSRDDFKAILENPTARTRQDGKLEIVVVNIQKFSDQSISLSLPGGIQTKRVFFIDEAHRSYNSNGSFLASLIKADPDAIHLGLTGTPRLVQPREGESPEETIKRDADTKALFGGYIDAYYYNQSIKDGYTLRLIHEVIETEFRSKLQKKLEEIAVLVGETKKRQVLYAHPNFVTPLVQYIVDDLVNARKLHSDPTIGGMIVCDSSEQAEMIQETLKNDYQGVVSSALILCDEGTKQFRKGQTDDFKNGKLDILVVFNMLLTGFDAPRLKKLYLGRVIKDHSLLQTLARVNRPYQDWNYGHVVDFADISNQFDKANKAYMAELQKELGGDWSNFSNVFKSHEEIARTLENTRNALWRYDTTNLEVFSQQLLLADKKELINLHRLLAEMRDLRGSIIVQDFDISAEELERFMKLDKEVSRRLAIVRWQQEIKSGEDTTLLLNAALAEMFFGFQKVDEKELKVAGELEELEDKLKKMKHEEDLILAKYEHDAKYARLHRRLMEYVRENEPNLTPYERSLCEALGQLKTEVDDIVEKKSAIIQNYEMFQGEIRYCLKNIFTSYSESTRLPKTSIQLRKFITTSLANEYKEQIA